MLVVGWQVQGSRLSVQRDRERERERERRDTSPSLWTLNQREREGYISLSLWTLNLLPCTCQPTTNIFDTTHRVLELR
jgi:hypothetical protein